MKQKYKEAIAFFRQHPEETLTAWSRPVDHLHGCLFQFCSPDGRCHVVGDKSIGCPLMIANSENYIAWSLELTERCRHEFPVSVEEITDIYLIRLGTLQTDMDNTIRDSQWLAEHPYACYEATSDPLVLAGLRGEAIKLYQPESDDLE